MSCQSCTLIVSFAPGSNIECNQHAKRSGTYLLTTRQRLVKVSAEHRMCPSHSVPKRHCILQLRYHVALLDIRHCAAMLYSSDSWTVTGLQIAATHVRVDMWQHVCCPITALHMHFQAGICSVNLVMLGLKSCSGQLSNICCVSKKPVVLGL